MDLLSQTDINGPLLSSLLNLGLAIINFALTIAWAGLVYILPGYALTSLLLRPQQPNRRDLLQIIALSAAISISLYPLLYLWTNVAGLQAGKWISWLPGVASLFYLLWQVISLRIANQQYQTNTAVKMSGIYVMFGAVILALLITRLAIVQSMLAPAWGDSVHHTLIVQLLLDNNGLFQSWAPYTVIESFTYHFGFHTAIAALATVSGLSAPQAVIVGGQLLNVFAVLAIYPLATRLGSSRVTGLVAVLVAGFISQQPGMFVNWGRYTQLTAQIILPVFVWALDVWWTEPKRQSRSMLILITLLAAGLALTHYRVAVIGATAAIAWGMWSLWQLRRDIREWLWRTGWLILAGIGAALLIAPWVRIILVSRLAESAAIIAERSKDVVTSAGELALWNTLTGYYWTALLVVAVAALVIALWRRPRMAVPIAIWALLSFAAANPFLLRMAGSGLVTNFLLILALYIPVSVLVGWMGGELWNSLANIQTARIGMAAAAILLSVLGMRYQLHIVDPFYQLVAQSDVAAMKWIDDNTPEDSRFLVNAFLAYGDRVVAGSDAGWWLPYYTQRGSNLPPMLYSVERLADGVDREDFPRLVSDIQTSAGNPDALRSALCEFGISYVYLGDKQGQVGLGIEPLINPAWLKDNPDFTLDFQSGDAQVWSFAVDHCSPFN